MSRIRTITLVSLIAVVTAFGATIPAWANGGMPSIYACWCACEDRGEGMVYMCMDAAVAGEEKEICVNYHAVETLALHGFRLGRCAVPDNHWPYNPCGFVPLPEGGGCYEEMPWWDWPPCP